MGTVPSGSSRGGTSRPLAVILTAFLMVAIGFGVIVTSAGETSAVAGRSAEPGDPTVPTPTVAPTVAPTAAPTQPPVSATTPEPGETPETVAPPQTTWDSGGSSGGWSQGNGGDTQTRSTVTYDTSAGSSETTLPPMTTTEDLLIGPSTTAAPSTTVAKRALTGSSVTRSGGSSDPKIWAVVGALVFVALALAVTTMAYWRRTRPDRADEEVSEHGRRGRRSKRSRYADIVVTAPEP